MDSLGMKCFKCGKEGHIKKECPELKCNKKNKIKCFGCGKHGHIVRECPEETKKSGKKAMGDTVNLSSPVVSTSSVNFIDSHCHIDYVLERYRYNANNFKKFQQDYSFPDTFSGCITTFCDPASFSSLGTCDELLQDDQIWGTFGFHPHNAKYYNEQMEEKLLKRLAHPKTVALGEIGLDYSPRSQSEPEIQGHIFLRQVKLAQMMEKPVVIHCREAESDVFEILSANLPRSWKIHLHCFTGDYHMAKTFMDYFPNLFLGISGIVTFSKATQVHNVVYDVPVERILLETDAPYLIPTSVSKTMKWSHPGLIPHIANEIAEIKNISVDMVMEHALENTKKLYSL